MMEQLLGIERINPWRLCPRTADMAPPHLAFEVKFQKENVVGEGGPYRVFDEICRELQSSDGLFVIACAVPEPTSKFWGKSRKIYSRCSTNRLFVVEKIRVLRAVDGYGCVQA